MVTAQPGNQVVHVLIDVVATFTCEYILGLVSGTFNAKKNSISLSACRATCHASFHQSWNRRVASPTCLVHHHMMLYAMRLSDPTNHFCCDQPVGKLRKSGMPVAIAKCCNDSRRYS
jgi:hypothetical protein